MKKLFRISALILLVLVGCYVLLRYVLFPIVPVDHLYDDIPAGADYVILIDTDELLSLSLSEFLRSPFKGNPFEDMDEEEDDDDDRYDLGKLLKKGLWNGLEIPEHVIFYVNEFGDGPKQILLPLSSEADFRSFLEDSSEKSGWYVHENGLWTNDESYIYLKKDHLILFFSRPEINRDVDFTSRDWSLEISHGMDEEHAFARYHITRRSQPIGHGAIRSQQGKVLLTYQSNQSLGFEGRAVASAPFSMALQVDMAELHAIVEDKSEHHFLQKPIRKSSLSHLIKDSIWDGRFELYIHGISSEQQEFISYTYNDDFEKIERKEIKNVLNADLWAEIGLAKPTDSLFYEKGWVKEVDGTDLFVKYPIQEVKFTETLEQVILNSGEIDSTNNITDTQSELFLSFDVPTLERDWNQNTPDSLAFLSGLEHIEGRITEASHALQFELKFTDDDRQGLFSFMDVPFIELLR